MAPDDQNGPCPPPSVSLPRPAPFPSLSLWLALVNFEQNISCIYTPQLLSWVSLLCSTPMKMEWLVSSKTWALKAQTPGDYPKDTIRQEHCCCRYPSSTIKLLINVWFYLFCRTVHIHTIWDLRWIIVLFGICFQCFQPSVFPVGRFSSWSFCLSDVIQPVAIQVWRPPFADVAPSALATNIWADIFWFLFVPCTMFTLR